MRFLLLCVALIAFSMPANGEAKADEFSDFNRRTEQLLMQGAFDELEAMADTFRKTDARFPGSHSKLYHLYFALGDFKPPSSDCACTDPNETVSFDEKAHALKMWLTHRPESITARLALARLFMEYAWYARGHLYSNAVKEQQWNLFRDRMKVALGYLKGISAKDDPDVYVEYAQIARDFGSRSDLDKIYAAETRDYPTFFHFYAERATALQERWEGRPGELAQYTRSLLSSPGGETGQIAYTYVAGRLLTEFSRDRVFEETGVDWPTLKQAYFTRKRLFGWSNSDKRVLLTYAIAAHDDAFADDLRARWSQ